ncbi:dual OB domain-containing protein [Priestia aryabhattai]
MKICILAVTKAAFNEYCIAGMTDEGKWVRPIPSVGNSRFWTHDQLTCQVNGFLQVGDVLEFNGQAPSAFQHPNHTEDFLVSAEGMILQQRFSNDELMNFLHDKAEGEREFSETIYAQGRSLCLIKVNHFQQSITQWEDGPKKPKMTFSHDDFTVTNPHTKAGDYIVKDCKWASVVLNRTVSNLNSYSDLYLAIGLATKNNFDGKEYPQVIGLHTAPLVESLATYPH